MRLRWFLTVPFAICLLSTSIEAQTQTCKPDEPTTWWPRFRPKYTGPVSPADLAIINRNLSAVEAIVRKTAWGTPRGFAVMPGFHYTVAENRKQIMWYSFSTNAYPACSKYSENGSELDIVINSSPMGWSESDRPVVDENDDSVFVQRVREKTMFGATAAYGYSDEKISEGLFLVFTRGGESPTIPVTREEWLRAQIFVLEGRNQEKLKEALAFTTKTQYERWLERAAERKKSIDDIVKGVSQVDPAQGAKARADLEKADRAAGETLKKSDAQEREDLKKTAASLTIAGDRMRAQIAAMSPKERASPAFIHGDAKLVPPDTLGAMEVVRRNPNFYRTATSPFEPRLILVHLNSEHDATFPPPRQIYKEMDWVAIKGLVNQ